VKLVGIDLSHRDREVCMLEDNTATHIGHESSVMNIRALPGFSRRRL
jgi:hypothetical protein